MSTAPEADLVDTARLRALLAGVDVTELPWRTEQTVTGAEHWVVSARRGFFAAVTQPATGPDDYGRANAELIAAGISALPALLDEVEAARTASPYCQTDPLDAVLAAAGFTRAELADSAAAGRFESLHARLAWLAVQALEAGPALVAFANEPAPTVSPDDLECICPDADGPCDPGCLDCCAQPTSAERRPADHLASPNTQETP